MIWHHRPVQLSNVSAVFCVDATGRHGGGGETQYRQFARVRVEVTADAEGRHPVLIILKPTAPASGEGTKAMSRGPLSPKRIGGLVRSVRVVSSTPPPHAEPLLSLRPHNIASWECDSRGNGGSSGDPAQAASAIPTDIVTMRVRDTVDARGDGVVSAAIGPLLPRDAHSLRQALALFADYAAAEVESYHTPPPPPQQEAPRAAVSSSLRAMALDSNCDSNPYMAVVRSADSEIAAAAAAAPSWLAPLATTTTTTTAAAAVQHEEKAHEGGCDENDCGQCDACLDGREAEDPCEPPDWFPPPPDPLDDELFRPPKTAAAASTVAPQAAPSAQYMPLVPGGGPVLEELVASNALDAAIATVSPSSTPSPPPALGAQQHQDTAYSIAASTASESSRVPSAGMRTRAPKTWDMFEAALPPAVVQPTPAADKQTDSPHGFILPPSLLRQRQSAVPHFAARGVGALVADRHGPFALSPACIETAEPARSPGWLDSGSDPNNDDIDVPGSHTRTMGPPFKTGGHVGDSPPHTWDSATMET